MTIIGLLTPKCKWCHINKSEYGGLCSSCRDIEIQMMYGSPQQKEKYKRYAQQAQEETSIGKFFRIAAIAIVVIGILIKLSRI